MATGGSTTKKQNRLLQLIECPICLNEMEDPRLLSCRHALCHKCLKDYTEKGDYVDEVPCPVCRQITRLYQGGVDNLPEFFFMNSLKEVVLEDEVCTEDSQSGPVCSTESCTKSSVNYCTQCQFMCQQCYDDHQSIGITKTHKVIPSSESEEFIKSTKPPFPPCRRHKHQLMDLYCQTCNLPVCNTCFNSSHRGHHCCELEEQADICKAKLEQISVETDKLIGVIKQAMDKTKFQVHKAESDIDEACENVKSTFKLMHDKLDEEEKKMWSKLQEARQRVIKAGAVTTDGQEMSLASLESVKSCQVKLAARGDDYDYVTVTDSLQRDIDNHYCRELAGFAWSSKIATNEEIREFGSRVFGYSGHVEIKQSEQTEVSQLKIKNVDEKEGKPKMGLEKVKEVRRMAQQNDNSYVIGMVIYKQHVYTVHQSGLAVYCYTQNGVFCSKYKYEIKAKINIEGMCLIMKGDKAELVINDWSNKALVWINILDDSSLKYNRTQQLQYYPCGSYNDLGELMVCDCGSRKIRRYSCDGQALAVINLPDDVKPWGVTRHGDQYVISDWWNKQVVLINKEGLVKKRYKGDIHGIKLGHTFDVISSSNGTLLVADNENHKVLMLNMEEDEVKQVLQQQHVRSPVRLYLSSDHQLYVSGRDQNEKVHVFVFDYQPINRGKSYKQKITKLDLTMKM